MALQHRNLSVDRQRLALWTAAVFMLGVLAFAAWQYVGTVVLGLFAYYVTRPLYVRVQRFVPTRTLAVFVSLVLVTLPVILLFAWTLLVAVQQVSLLLESGNFDQFVAFIEPYVNLSAATSELQRVGVLILEDPTRIFSTGVNGQLGEALVVVLGSLGELFNALLHLFVVLVIAFYLLRDDYRLAQWAHGTFVDLDGVLDTYFRAVDRDLKNIYFGNILNVFVTGLLGALVYNGLNLFAPAGVAVPQPTLLGLLTGAASLIPVIGMKLVWIPAALLLLVRSLLVDPSTVWFVVAFAGVSVVVVDTIPDQLLRPYVSGRSLHVGAVMLAYILGPLLFGWYGLFLGPLVLVVVVEFGRIVLPWLVHGEEMTPTPMTEASDEPAEVAEETPEGLDEERPEDVDHRTDDDAQPEG